MEINQWQELIAILERIKTQFNIEDRNFKQSTNQKNRKEFSRQFSNSIELARQWVWRYPEAVELLYKNSTDGMQRMEIRDEFVKEIYFNELLSGLIDDIKEEKLSP